MVDHTASRFPGGAPGLEESRGRPPQIVPEAFGSTFRAERTQSRIPNIPRTLIWKLLAGPNHLTPISPHRAFFLFGAEGF